MVTDSAPRVILALSALSEASQLLEDRDLREIALAGIRHCCDHITEADGLAMLALPGTPCGPMAEAFLLNAAYRRETGTIQLAALQSLLSRFRTFFHSDGAISWLPEGRRMESEHDLFPGAALQMIAHVAEKEGPDVLPPFLGRHLDFYRRRFRLKPSWGMLFWQTQGWTAIDRVSPGRLEEARVCL